MQAASCVTGVWKNKWIKACRCGWHLLLLAIAMLSLSSCGQGDGGSGLSPTTTTLATPLSLTATPSPALAPSATLPSLPPSPVPSPTLALLSGQSSLNDPLTPGLGNTGYDVLHYELQLAVDPPTEFISGTTSIEAVTTLPNLRRISLDFVGLTITSLTVNEQPADFEREGGELWVTFPEPLLIEGTPFTIGVAYSGEPVQEDSPYIHYVDYLGIIFPGNNTFYTLSEPDGARYWFPSNDHPLDKATFRIELTVPKGLAAISNGQLVNSWLDTMPDGSEAATFVWAHNYPMATYLALAAGGHYRRVEDESPAGVPLVYYYFPELEEEYLEAVEITGEALDWLSDLFGPYPFDSYGQATYYALDISMEMQAMTLLSYQMLDERTVVHELAHSWFGNWVSLETWADAWWKEGFATYMEVLWLSQDDLALRQELIAEIEAEVAEKGHGYPLNHPPQDRVMSFDTYHRGALLAHALHETVGDEAFFAGLRTFFERYAGGNATLDEFQVVMEEASGIALDSFFNEWLQK